MCSRRIEHTVVLMVVVVSLFSSSACGGVYVGGSCLSNSKGGITVFHCCSILQFGLPRSTRKGLEQPLPQVLFLWELSSNAPRRCSVFADAATQHTLNFHVLPSASLSVDAFVLR